MDVSDYRPSRVWRRMTPDARLVAAELFWSDEHSTELQADAVAALAAHLKFRTKSILALPAERRTRYLATLPTISDAIVARALVGYHLGRQRPMMCAFLDGLGIAHENGMIADETVAKPDTATLRRAAADLASKYPADDVWLYFATLVSQDLDVWGDLRGFSQMSSASGP